MPVLTAVRTVSGIVWNGPARPRRPKLGRTSTGTRVASNRRPDVASRRTSHVRSVRIVSSGSSGATRTVTWPSSPGPSSRTDGSTVRPISKTADPPSANCARTFPSLTTRATSSYGPRTAFRGVVITSIDPAMRSMTMNGTAKRIGAEAPLVAVTATAAGPGGALMLTSIGRTTARWSPAATSISARGAMSRTNSGRSYAKAYVSASPRGCTRTARRIALSPGATVGSLAGTSTVCVYAAVPLRQAKKRGRMSRWSMAGPRSVGVATAYPSRANTDLIRVLRPRPSPVARRTCPNFPFLRGGELRMPLEARPKDRIEPRVRILDRGVPLREALRRFGRPPHDRIPVLGRGRVPRVALRPEVLHR